jgi:hypothetical protein
MVAKNIRIYCSYYKAYYYADNTCNNYKGAYVTTAVCDILGKENFTDILNDIRNLRTLVMEKDPDCKKILDRYDDVGPIIGKRLMEDYKKNKDNSLAQNLFDYYIEPTAKMYEANDYIGAIEKYSSMQDVLEDIYRLKVTDYTNVGEARLIKYKKEVKC